MPVAISSPPVNPELLMIRTTGTTRTLVAAGLLLTVLLAGCRAPEGRSFSRVHRGMSEDEVIELLGPPSSQWSAPPPRPGDPPPNWANRWHYGDTLSTTASAALGQDIAPDEVWVVTFDDSGSVIDYRPPIPADDSFPLERPPK